MRLSVPITTFLLVGLFGLLIVELANRPTVDELRSTEAVPAAFVTLPDEILVCPRPVPGGTVLFYWQGRGAKDVRAEALQ